MSVDARRYAVTTAQRVVVKIGSSSLTVNEGGLNPERIRDLADVLAGVKARGAEIVLVSSGAIAAGLAPAATALYAGNARLTVVRVADLQELTEQVRQLGSLLQTAVIASSREQRAELAQLLLDAGVTRICLPGQAHEPEPLWPQDGIGRIAPLLG